MKNLNIKHSIYLILVISVIINLYFLFKSLPLNSSIVSIEDKTILTENELINELNKNYKVMIVNEKVNEYLLKLEATNQNINVPTNDELLEFANKFNFLQKYTNDLEKYRDKLISEYYSYKIYCNNGVENLELQNFIESYYGDKNANIFELNVFETVNHNEAVEVENKLKNNVPINLIEDELNIEFYNSYDVNMSSIKTDLENEKENFQIGNVYHIMDENGMKIIQIKEILNLEENKDYFIDLYFSKKSVSIKNEITNNLKGKYKISYN